jgi:hypothetical protein
VAHVRHGQDDSSGRPICASELYWRCPAGKKLSSKLCGSFNFLENDVIRRVHGRDRKVALLIEAYGPRMGMMRAINRHKFVEFDPKRKSPYWGNESQEGSKKVLIPACEMKEAAN